MPNTDEQAREREEKEQLEQDKWLLAK